MVNASIIVGSTGLVGKMLHTNLIDKNIEVLAITRRPVTQTSEIKNFLQINFDSFLKNGKLPLCDHLYICLGTTIKKAGSKKEFRRVDFEYSLAFAKQAKESGAKKISLISSIGANYKSNNFYLKIKGELEKAIEKINFEQTNIYRPSLIIGSRPESRFLEELGQKCSFVINLLLHGPLTNYRSVEVEKLSKCMASPKVSDGVNYYYFKDFN